AAWGGSAEADAEPGEEGVGDGGGGVGGVLLPLLVGGGADAVGDAEDAGGGHKEPLGGAQEGVRLEVLDLHAARLREGFGARRVAGDGGDGGAADARQARGGEGLHERGVGVRDDLRG